MSVLNHYQDFMVSQYENFPQSKYLTLVVLRKAESEMIFRTEGSGEGLNRDLVHAGLQDRERIPRVTISKRKQTAVERRTGRELLRQHNLLFDSDGKTEGKDDDICALNRNKPCGVCADCMIYGYAVGGGGAQKSRVITDDAFSILSFQSVTDKRTFNALYDNNTMRDPVTQKASPSIQEDEYVRPGTLFIDIETLKDLTAKEIQYVIGNILRSRRYGAITSRMGKMQNSIVSAIFSDCELFSNLELTQSVYDRLKDQDQAAFPLDEQQVKAEIQQAVESLSRQVIGHLKPITEQELTSLMKEMQTVFSSPENAKTLLDSVTALYKSND
ncbi:MAG: type I-D CRISPR-associated protein Cas7/Csc2 [Candidatus Poribacteria bacterium]|jgi:CRISPR-associated protein Csc2|nr:type I-D CRISPR-associated protein Cas7/Csc2 [Candidatus Poribacteria bacterium]MDP6750155.1 type I-D CRISPR-associated protein Cas7/Csc2 [Candidatus Poribacteria bacterium]MDP6998988.1 type I-D CRISPR-associated protein Cas7/Csc2 [Candidatus Poribacteria bacterium]